MKKLLALGMTAVMVSSVLTGCGKTSSKYLLDIKYADYVKICDYKGVSATKVNFEITDEQVQEEIQNEIYDNVTYDPITDRGVQEGDYVNIDYEANLEGTASEDYSGEDEDYMIGEEFLYPEVEKALVGMKTGEEKEVEVKLTEDFVMDEKDIGKKLSVKVTLNEISVENVPEYNDDYIKEYTDFDTMEKYEESVKQNLIKSTEDEYKYAAQQEIFTFLIDNSTFNGYPQELYDSCKENYDSANESYASMYGMELDEYLDIFGLDEETMEKDILDSVNYELVVGTIAQAEGIDCTDKEIKDFINEVYEDYGYDSAEEFSADYTNEEIGSELIYEKVADFLYENASFREISEEEYLKQQEAEYEMGEEDGEVDESEIDESEVDEETDEEVTEEEDSTKEEETDVSEETDAEESESAEQTSEAE